MLCLIKDEWMMLSGLYAFLGNSLLDPMNRTQTVGLDPDFWLSLAELCDDDFEVAVREMADWAQRARVEASEAELVTRVSAEYTDLFVGPPRPQAAPWESANGEVDSHVGFGEATFVMREYLRRLGLEVQNGNNQYEDHMGIELLVVSELCCRTGERCEDGIADGAIGTAGEMSGVAGAATGNVGVESPEVNEFIRDHPLAWIERFRGRVAQAAPDGYFVRLLDVAQALLCWQVA